MRDTIYAAFRCGAVLVALAMLPGAAANAVEPGRTDIDLCAANPTVDWRSQPRTATRLRSQLASGAFSELDRAMSCLAGSTRRFAGGEDSWSAIYWAFRLKTPPLGTPDQQAQRVNSWLSVNPGSLFARFARLRQIYDAAWFQRGSALASATAEDRFNIFYAALADLESRLTSAPADLKDTPIWSNLMLATLLDEQRPGLNPVTVFEAGVRRWPRYFELHEVMLSRLVPRWGGNWQLADAFIQSASKQSAATEGDVQYARLYVSVFHNHYSPSETLMKTERMRGSLREWMGRYPTPENINTIASTACLLGDGVLFRDAYGRLAETEVTPATWNATAQRNDCVARFAR